MKNEPKPDAIKPDPEPKPKTDETNEPLSDEQLAAVAGGMARRREASDRLETFKRP